MLRARLTLTVVFSPFIDFRRNRRNWRNFGLLRQCKRNARRRRPATSLVSPSLGLGIFHSPHR